MNKEALKRLAVELAEEKGLINLSREELCEKAGIPIGAFMHRAGMTYTDFVDELVREGVRGGSPTGSNFKRKHPVLMRNHILDSAIIVALERGYQNIWLAHVAEEARVALPTVNYHFKTIDNLKRETMQKAVDTEVLGIVVQGLGQKDEVALGASADLKQRAMEYATQL